MAEKERLTTYVNPTLAETIRLAAEKKGLSVTTWLMLAAVEQLRREEKK